MNVQHPKPAADRDGDDAGVSEDGVVQTVSTTARELTDQQLAAVQTAMALFAEEDLARGMPPWQTAYCPACHEARPLPGFVRYDPSSDESHVCNRCATEYEIARIQGLVEDIDEFVGSRANGERERDAGWSTAIAC